jgi:hypothetical protein
MILLDQLSQPQQRRLNARFHERLNRLKYKRIKITPLVSMNISSLERAVSAMREMPFSDVMEDRIQEDPMLGRPFEAASSWVPQGTPRNMDKHIEIMKVLAKEMQDDFGMVDDEAELNTSSPQHPRLRSPMQPPRTALEASRKSDI